MLVRWIAAGLDEARQSFRHVRGYTDIPKLIAAHGCHAAPYCIAVSVILDA